MYSASFYLFIAVTHTHTLHSIIMQMRGRGMITTRSRERPSWDARPEDNRGGWLLGGLWREVERKWMNEEEGQTRGIEDVQRAAGRWR